MDLTVSPFSDASCDPPVRGFLHTPASLSGDALGLTHGAGSDGSTPLLLRVAEAFAEAGATVLRFDLPYRQLRPHGPPRPGEAERDRAGIRNVVAALRNLGHRRVFLGGHSYGGRQSSMLVAAEPALVEGLLLLSYPLHPPRRPLQPRTAHFPELTAPVVFVHGSRDPFATLAELETATHLIPAPTTLFPIEGAGHDLRARTKEQGPSLLLLRDIARAVLGR